MGQHAQAIGIICLIFFALFLIFQPVQACENDDYWSFYAGAGKQGEWFSKDGDTWEGRNNTAAILRLGYHHRLSRAWWLTTEFDHHSHWDLGEPVNDKDEDHLESLTIGFEVHW